MHRNQQIQEITTRGFGPFFQGREMLKLINNDCLVALKEMESNSIDSLVTDPPAGISFMSKKWDDDKGGRKQWIAWLTEISKEMLRVLKPGAHGFVWAIPRTSHWTATALEDAGFEIRDCVTHLFGTGFPKSHNISKALQKKGVENSDDYTGLGTGLKPSAEFYWLIRKPCSEKTVADNVIEHGTGGINIDASRIKLDGSENLNASQCRTKIQGGGYGNGEGKIDNKPIQTYKPEGRWPANTILSGDVPEMLDDQSGVLKSGAMKPTLTKAIGYHGTKTEGYIASQEASEGGASRFFMVFKSVCGLEKTEADDTSVGKSKASKNECSNQGGFGESIMVISPRDAISITKTKTHSIMNFQISNASTSKNIGTCIVKTDSDIKQSMLLNIGSVSVAKDMSALITFKSEEMEPIKGTAKLANVNTLENGEKKNANIGTPITENTEQNLRFLYQAKPSKREKGIGNFHPTCKSIKLMSYLINMITPTGGTVLDPFMGSGTTGLACTKEGFDFIGIEKELEYFEIAKNRLEES